MTTARFADQVVLITGGGKGIGRGITTAFLEAGATVLICGRSAPESLPEANGRQAAFIAADVRDAQQVEALFTQIQERYGRLDVLINNAGGTPFCLAADAPPRLHESIIALNLTAPLLLAQKANALMQQQDHGGLVLFIASVSAQRPSPGTAAYGAAKAGILNLTQSLAVEWAPKVRVVAVTPGLVQTEQSHLHYGDEAGIAAVSATIPLGRMAQPEDIASACLFLASPNAAYISGSNLTVHGGGERPAFLDAATVNRDRS